MHLYCVKIKQHRLADTHYDYFPFDRVYLLPQNKKKLALKLFRYSLILPLNHSLLGALEKVRFAKQYQTDTYRNDRNLKGTPVGENFNMLADLRNGKWLAVIPTYLARDKDINPDAPVPVSREVRLAYTLSLAVNRLHNLEATLPGVMLHTPTVDVPFLCALCKHVADYHANQCTPGREVCRHNMRLNNLPVSDDAHEKLLKSIEGSGEER